MGTCVRNSIGCSWSGCTPHPSNPQLAVTVGGRRRRGLRPNEGDPLCLSPRLNWFCVVFCSPFFFFLLVIPLCLYPRLWEPCWKDEGRLCVSPGGLSISVCHSLFPLFIAILTDCALQPLASNILCLNCLLIFNLFATLLYGDAVWSLVTCSPYCYFLYQP